MHKQTMLQHMYMMYMDLHCLLSLTMAFHIVHHLVKIVSHSVVDSQDILPRS